MSEALRRVMRRVPAPVVVVTATGGEAARGVTIGSFTSVSLAPPLVSFNLSRDGQAHPVITAADRFAIHILRDDQWPLATRFALASQTPDEQFDGVDHRVGTDGVPLLEGALAVLHCRRYAVYPAGDSDIVVGEVAAVDQAAGDGPLLYQDRAYRTIGSRVRRGA